MGWTTEMASRFRQLESRLANSLAQLFLVTLTSRSSSLGDSDAIESSDEAVDPGAPSNEKKGQRPAARYQPWGFNGRPPKGVRGLALRLGSSNVLWLGIAPQNKYGPQNLDVGETALYSSGGCTVVLDKNGAVKITDKGGATATLDGTGNVSINPAAGKALKLGDQATPVTGSVALGPVGTLAVLVQGSVDSLGVPVTQNPAASATIVKAG